MKSKLFLLSLLMSFLIISNQRVIAEEYKFEDEYELPNPMADFIPDNLITIRNLIRKHKNVDAKYINNDLAIIIYEFYPIPHAVEKIKKAAFLILFKVPQKSELQSDANKTVQDFMSGNTSNIKEIFWSNQGNPVSWSKKKEELESEKRCICKCDTGIFSSRLCMMSECPLANQTNEE